VRANEVNGAFFRSLSSIDSRYVQGRSDLRLVQVPTGEIGFIYFNLKQPILEDRRVRQALLHALNRDAILKEVFQGQALKPESPIAMESWAYEPSLRRYGYDRALAALLLDEAGWRLTPAGVRMRGSIELAFSLATNSDPVRVAAAQAVAQAWNSLGARVTVEARGATALVRDLLEQRSFQVALFASTAEPDPDPYAAWHSSQATGRDGNLSSLDDARFDRLISEARGNVRQPQRRELYAQFQELFAQEVPSIPLYASYGVYVHSTSLQGLRLRVLSSPGDRFWQVQEWHLKTR
jgi:peptide/nickel transport system substrate-binding protein